MKIKNMWLKIGNIAISSKHITKLSIECGRAVIEYSESNTPKGVSKFSTLVCRSSEVEFICPYEDSEEYRAITGNVTILYEGMPL